jgi:2-succinyl-6-hydroxy-2,4-cyclohexadiene-1-carboxylate synthase
MSANVRWVLLHGFTGGPDSWDTVRAQLDGQVFAPALAGHDGGPGTAKTFGDEVDRLADAIVAAKFTGARLGGYSLGGRVAIGLLARHAKLFSAATIFGASAGLASAEERAARRADDERWARQLRTEGLEAFVGSWEKLPLWKTQASVSPAFLAEQRRRRLAHSAEGLATSLEVLGLGAMPSYHAALETLRIPLTFAAGEHDLKYAELAVRLAAIVPGAHAVLIPGAGHNVVLEAPDDVVALLRGVR